MLLPRARRLLILAILSLLLAAAASTTEPDKPPLDLTASELAVVRSGELVTKVEAFQDAKGRESHRLRHFQLINAPPEAVWKVLSNPEQDREWIPGVVVSRVLQRGENWVDIHYEVEVLWMTFQFNIHRVFHRPILFIKNDLIEGMDNDLKVSDSYYSLYPDDDGRATIMNYTLRIAVSDHVPDAVEQWFAKVSGDGWMANLKKRAESGGTWKKE